MEFQQKVVAKAWQVYRFRQNQLQYQEGRKVQCNTCSVLRVLLRNLCLFSRGREVVPGRQQLYLYRTVLEVCVSSLN